jgi:hypothetical protein
LRRQRNARFRAHDGRALNRCSVVIPHHNPDGIRPCRRRGRARRAGAPAGIVSGTAGVVGAQSETADGPHQDREPASAAVATAAAIARTRAKRHVVARQTGIVELMAADPAPVAAIQNTSFGTTWRRACARARRGGSGPEPRGEGILAQLQIGTAPTWRADRQSTRNIRRRAYAHLLSPYSATPRPPDHPSVPLRAATCRAPGAGEAPARDPVLDAVSRPAACIRPPYRFTREAPRTSGGLADYFQLFCLLFSFPG